MKKIHSIQIIILALIMGATSCTMQKRLYRPGYYIAKNHGNHHSSKKETTTHATTTMASHLNEETNPMPSISSVTFKQTEDELSIVLASVESAPAHMTASAKVASHKKVYKPVINEELQKHTISFNRAGALKSFVMKQAVKKAISTASSKPSKGVLYVLAFILPWLAVGLATDWDGEKLLINILLTILCLLPGIIHAIVVVSKSK